MPAIEATRRGASWVHLGLALLVVAGVFAQVYLIGAYVFGAGSEALDAHLGLGLDPASGRPVELDLLRRASRNSRHPGF